MVERRQFSAQGPAAAQVRYYSMKRARVGIAPGGASFPDPSTFRQTEVTGGVLISSVRISASLCVSAVTLFTIHLPQRRRGTQGYAEKISNKVTTEVHLLCHLVRWVVSSRPRTVSRMEPIK